jgi:peptide/nickel transport system substrate-binding protein
MAGPRAIGTDALRTTPVGTGPYTLDAKATTRTVQYTYVKNPKYWNAAAYPYDKIVLKPILDGTARLNAIRSGQVDGGTGDATTIPTAKGAGLKVLQSAGPGFQGLFIFDRAGKIVPQLADVRVRQAINYAIDPRAILSTLADGKGTLTRQVFNPRSNGWDPSLNSAYAYDPAKARALLASAGAANGFALSMPVPVYPNLQPLLTQQLAAVGIKVNWVNVLRDLRRERGMSMLMVTHDFGVVADICDRVAVMRDGHIVEQDDVRATFAQPHDDYTRTLLEAGLHDTAPRPAL